MHRPRLPLAVLCAIVLVALGVRLAWIAIGDFQPTLDDDAGRYDFLGRSLADGAGYINPNGATTMFWPPGYPFLLAGIYKGWPEGALGDHQLTAALVANALLGAATVALTYGVAMRALRHQAGALLAAATFALFPSMVFITGVTLSETLFTFLLVLAAWLAIEERRRPDALLVVVIGAVTGYAALTRGQALLLPIAFVPAWLLSEESDGIAGPRWWAAASRLLVTGAVVAIVVAPWAVRNHDVSGEWVLISSNAGPNFYIGHSEDADGKGRQVPELVFRYPELPPAEAEARVNRDGFEEGMEWALDHPLEEAWLSATKVFWLYYIDSEGLFWTDAHGGVHVWDEDTRDAWEWASNAYWWAALALAGIGAFRWSSLRDPARVLLISVFVYWTLVHVAFFADPRFHAPVVPIVSVWAAAGVLVLSRTPSGVRWLRRRIRATQRSTG